MRTKIFLQENAFESVDSKMSAILLGPKYSHWDKSMDE